MRPKQSVAEKIVPDPRWDALASMWFLEPGISVDLHTAASIGDVEGVKQWISRGSDLNALNRGGWTPLMYAAYLGHEEVCQLLLLFDRLSIDARSLERRQTALMLAASCGNENLVGLLLKYGASLDAVDNRYRSALHYATDCNHAQIVRQLLIAGANPNLPLPPDVQGQDRYLTPFQSACNDGLDVMVHYFLQCGAAENQNVAESARALASKNGYTKIVSMIENFRQSGGTGLKLDDKQRSRAVLDGPNAISSLMRLQCKLGTPNDSDSHFQDYRAASRQQPPPAHSRQRSVDDYEKTLTVEQPPRPKTIEELMDHLQLNKYLDVFKEHNVDLAKLLTMNGEDLKEIGIKLFGPRKKILNAIERWEQNVPLTGVL